MRAFSFFNRYMEVLSVGQLTFDPRDIKPSKARSHFATRQGRLLRTSRPGFVPEIFQIKENSMSLGFNDSCTAWIVLRLNGHSKPTSASESSSAKSKKAGY